MAKFKTRRAPHMEKFTQITRHGRGVYRLRLKVGVQRFIVAYDGTKKEVEWMRDMLCNALDKLVAKANEDKS